MGKFKCDSCFHKRACQESPAYGTVMEDCPSYINVEIDNSVQQLKPKMLKAALRVFSKTLCENCAGNHTERRRLCQ